MLVTSNIFVGRIGRKQVFVFCILLMSVTGIAQAISPDYITFQVFVFINAMGTAGVYPLAFIIGEYSNCSYFLTDSNDCKTNNTYYQRTENKLKCCIHNSIVPRLI